MRNLLKVALLACGACFAAGTLGTPALAAGYSEYSTNHGYYYAPSYYEPAYSARYEPYYNDYYSYRSYNDYYAYASYNDYYSYNSYGYYPYASYNGYYSYGSYYGGYYGYRTRYAGRPYFYSTYGDGYDTPCSRLVQVYDDAGGWVWGRRYYC